MASRKEAWEELGDPVASNIMTEGLSLRFLSPPPLSILPPAHTLPSTSQLPAIREFLPGLLSRGIIRRIHSPQPLFFSRPFVVPKKDGPNRLIIDLSSLNRLLLTPSFKMETVSSIASCIVEPMWGCTVDLKDAFYHVPVAWSCHIFLAFVVDFQIYVFQVLPFGLSIAPWAFSRITKPIKAHLHLLLFRIHTFLDDFLLLAPTKDSLLELTSYVLSLLQRLGILINYKKSHLPPSQTVEYLGVTFHLDSLLLSLPEDKVLKVMSLCQDAIHQSQLSRRQLECLVGVLNFASNFVPLGRLRLRPVVSWMNLHTSAESRDLPIPLDPMLKVLLGRWTDASFLRSPVPMSQPIPSLQLMTDASRTGWGGVLIPYSASGTWPTSYASCSTNWLELQAVFLSVLHFLPLLQGRCVQLLSDNTTVIACILRQGTLRSPSLMDLSTSILEFCFAHSISLVPKHLSGSLNVLADQGSRSAPISTEWSLDADTFRWVVSLSGPLQVDLFATRENHQLPHYVSPCPDQDAVEVNAFSISWDHWESIYLFPPVPLLPKVSSLLLQYRGRGVLIAPFYAQSSWLPNLLLRSPDPLPLPSSHSLSQMTNSGRVFHQNPSVYRLHAWRL